MNFLSVSRNSNKNCNKLTLMMFSVPDCDNSDCDYVHMWV